MTVASVPKDETMNVVTRETEVNMLYNERDKIERDDGEVGTACSLLRALAHGLPMDPMDLYNLTLLTN